MPLLPFAVKAWTEYTIKLSNWDLVDSGKHLDWDGTSAYIIFNTYYMNNFNTSKKRNVAIYELGHALGLDYRDGESSSVMQSYVTSITTLCEVDRKNYDEAYKKY